MKRNTISKKRALAGWMFVLPWFIGLLVFFIQPTAKFLIFSFFDFQMSQTGGYDLLPLENGAFGNYINAWLSDSEYPVAFADAFKTFLYEVPIIVFFSLFVAILLNQDFKGRALMRTIFFLPIILTSGALSLVISRGVGAIAMGVDTSSSTIFDVSLLTELLMNSGISQKIVSAVTGVIASVADLIWDSGVQILIFLIGLLSIPETYYEVARVEGATGWESFWKITFPVICPFIFANMVYTFITACMGINNGVIDYVLVVATENFDYSFASAMMWMYFVAMLVIIGGIFAIFRKMLFNSK
ncbi:MAG: sugar ABC transporter permease [Clostridia bacterium]|nr:sugar ABC transporter permease [Clostridia bacterium]